VVGTTVTFAIGVHVVVVREGRGERTLPLLSRTDKPKMYSSPGAGHYIKAVAANGQTVTLEDGSVWTVIPEQQFLTREWQPLSGITVTYDRRDPPTATADEAARAEFDYLLTNTDADEGASAKLASER